MNKSFNIKIESDEKGFYDRQCPKCKYEFKVLMSDWREKCSDDSVICPKCGHDDKAENYDTEYQKKKMNNIIEAEAYNVVGKELDNILKKSFKSIRRKGAISITYKSNFKPKHVNKTIYSKDAWEQEIVCDECEMHYSVIGNAYFCPCCGRNNVKSSYLDTLNIQMKRIQSIDVIKKAITEESGIDTAQSICDNMIEDSLINCVSAFQKLAKTIYTEKTGISIRGNVFQNVNKGRKKLIEELDLDYINFISEDELSYLNVCFEQRHLLEHNKGFVDEDYSKNVGDNSLEIGQRIIVKKHQVEVMIGILKKLGEGIMAL